jgi:hypothetical protein
MAACSSDRWSRAREDRNHGSRGPHLCLRGNPFAPRAFIRAVATSDFQPIRSTPRSRPNPASCFPCLPPSADPDCSSYERYCLSRMVSRNLRLPLGVVLVTQPRTALSGVRYDAAGTEGPLLKLGRTLIFEPRLAPPERWPRCSRIVSRPFPSSLRLVSLRGPYAILIVN